MPGYMPGAHHRLICEKMEAVERGEIKRLLLCCPPRHGKSEIVSRRFPAWFLGRNPKKQIISASYGQDLANDFGRDVRNILADPSFTHIFPGTYLAADSAAKHRWHTNAGGSYVAAGVGAPITGRGAHVLNIDDPVKDRREAESQATRDAVWDWYTSTAYTRLMPGGCIVLTLTRWHEDDLAGRLLAAQSEGGDQWHVVSMPAINEWGEPLWPERYDYEALDGIRNVIGSRDWSALYQQEPRPSEGTLFRVEQIGTVSETPTGGKWVRRWDLAATAQVGTRDPDWTVGVLMQRTERDAYVVHDVVRLRGGPDEVEAAILATAQRDGTSVPIEIPQDPGQAGKSQTLYYAKRLAGYRFKSERESGDKETRAAPFAAQVNVGNVVMRAAAWNRAFIDELRGFPNATHDDQVDAAAGAFNALIAPIAPARFAYVPFMAR